MKKNTGRLISGTAIILFVYIALALWHYFQGKTDSTGWVSLGIFASIIYFILPLFAAICGIAGQLIFNKVWLFPIINAIGAAIFLALTLLLVKGYAPAIFILVPVAFVISFVFSLFTLLFQKAAAKKKAEKQ